MNQRGNRGRSQGRRGFTLLEVLVSIAIVGVMSIVIYGTLDGLTRTSRAVSVVDDRYAQGRLAVDRVSRELSAAFISAHEPFSEMQLVRKTAFVGHNDSSGDRVDFNSFSHRRLQHQSHESDQNELSYFVVRRPGTRISDLVRREAKYLDTDPGRGGVVQVLAEDVERFELKYLDSTTGEWRDDWDSVQAAAQFGRLPAAVWVVVVLGNVHGADSVRFETKVPIAIQLPLSFATGFQTLPKATP